MAIAVWYDLQSVKLIITPHKKTKSSFVEFVLGGQKMKQMFAFLLLVAISAYTAENCRSAPGPGPGPFPHDEPIIPECSINRLVLQHQKALDNRQSIKIAITHGDNVTKGIVLESVGCWMHIESEGYENIWVNTSTADKIEYTLAITP